MLPKPPTKANAPGLHYNNDYEDYLYIHCYNFEENWTCFSLGELLQLGADQTPFIHSASFQLINHLNKVSVKTQQPKAKTSVNWTRVLYLAVLPVPNRDSIWIIGCHHPWMRRMQLDLNDFIARRPKRFQAKHLLLIRKLIRVQKLATTKKNGFRKLSRSKSRFRFSSNLSRIWTPCRFQECAFIERTELKNAPLVSNCAFQATKQGISKTSPCVKW